MEMNTDERALGPQIVPLNFLEKVVPDGKGGQKVVEWVEWQKKGVQTPSITAEKIARLMPREPLDGKPGREAAPEWVVIEPFYKAWKDGQEPPESGTPLGVWPACPPGLAEMLKGCQVKTVEDFVAMPDDARRRINYPNISSFVPLGIEFLKNKELSAQAADLTEEVRRENAELKRMVEELQDNLEQLTAPKSEMAEEAPKRRGRPPKKAD